MENASKALLMAAGVLIGILILSLAVYLFISFGGTSADIHDKVQKDQLAKFNTQFTNYETKDSVTIYDIISVANLATENNKENQLQKKSAPTTGNDNYITVKLKGRCIEGGENTDVKQLEKEYNQRIVEDINTQNNGELKKYKAKTYISKETGRVYLIDFIEK